MLPICASVVVAGGGPAGFMAAITAAEAGVRNVIVLEATPEPLHKVLISGGGRCNVTHGCWDTQALVGHYPRGGKALRSTFSRFSPADTVAWFAGHGLPLVEEPDGRLFPLSNHSHSVVATLRQAAEEAGVRLHTGQALKAVEVINGGGFQLTLRDGISLQAHRLVLATGSHPSGHRLVTSLGHELVPPVPSLFTIALEDHPLASLTGVSMDPVVLELLPEGGRSEGASSRSSSKRAQGNPPQRGAVLITQWGLSGPATLRLTAFAARDLKEARYRGCLQVDWTGGLSPQEIDWLFQRAREEWARRLLINARPWPALSRRLWAHLLHTHGVEADRRWADLAKGQRRQLIQGLRSSHYTISGRGPFGEEFVMAGGVPLDQVNLTSMQSRLNPNLFLVGELLDVDGVTGGFNFQHCWSGGWLAGQALAAQQATDRP